MKLRHVDLPPRALGLDRTLVLLHGFGADEHDLIPIAEELDPRLRVVSLQAPIALDFGGRAWFNLLQTGEGFAFDPDEVAEGARLTAEAVEEIARTSPRPVLCGFSQGAGMALSVALQRPDLPGPIVALSAVPPRAEQLAAPERLRDLKILLAHGSHDPRVPPEVAHATRDLLQQAGASVTYREYPMGHMVIPQEISDARSWLARALV
jgi:phospholipase/carboxylesterase